MYHFIVQMFRTKHIAHMGTTAYIPVHCISKIQCIGVHWRAVQCNWEHLAHMAWQLRAVQCITFPLTTDQGFDHTTGFLRRSPTILASLFIHLLVQLVKRLESVLWKHDIDPTTCCMHAIAQWLNTVTWISFDNPEFTCGALQESGHP